MSGKIPARSAYLPVATARTLGVPWQPSNTQAVEVVATGRVTIPLGAEATAGRIEFRCDAANPPTTVRGHVVRARLDVGGALSTIEGDFDGAMTFTVPKGWWVSLVSVVEAGAPLMSLPVAVQETPKG